MKAKIIDCPLTNCIDIIPTSREEFLELRKLWSSNIQFKKGGCCIHASGITHHGIINSSFAILIRKKQKRFPMQDGPDIDWITAEKIYEIYSELYGTEQSLERLAERGGFGWEEVAMLVKDLKRRKRRRKGKGRCL